MIGMKAKIILLIFSFLFIFISIFTSLGFGTTIIGTGTTISSYTFQRAMCRDGQGNLHVVWWYDSYNIYYANSSDDGATWSVNTSFYGATSASDSRKFSPDISCDGNNITVVYEDYYADDVIVAISENNGATWNWYNPVITNVRQYPVVERRGQNIYIVFLDYNYDLKFINSTDGGSTWGSEIVLVDETDFLYPSMVVNGIGSSNDKIYVAFRDTSDGDIYFINSTDSGVTWGSRLNIHAGSFTYPSMSFSGTNLYVAYDTSSDIYFTNSTNEGITWTSGYTIMTTGTSIYPSLTVDDNGNPWVFWRDNNNNANHDIAFKKYNGATWEAEKYITYDNTGNTYVNTKYDFSNNRIELVWQRKTSSPYNIVYSYIDFTGSPNIPGYPGITPQSPTSASTLNCTALYNGANSGRIDFIWYKDNILQNYNGSANNLNNLDRGWTNVTISTPAAGSWICSARAYNGSDYSAWINSSAVSVSDVTPPTYSNDGDNSSAYGSYVPTGSPVKIYVKWNDETKLSKGIFRTNITGSWVNQTWNSFSSNSEWFNTTLSTTGYENKTICWDQWANDTSNNWNTSMPNNIHCFSVGGIPPTYSDNSTDSTLAGTLIEFRLKWTDNVGLSKAITSLWNGSSWVNASSWCSLSGSSSWCNQTLVVNSTPQQLWWKQYANDTSNNWNTSENFSLVTTDSIPPTYSDNSTNSTIAGTAVEHRLKCTDNLGLSGYIFSWHNGANWTSIDNSGDKESGEQSFSGEATVEYYELEFETFISAGEPGIDWISTGSTGCAWTRDDDGTSSSSTGPCSGSSNCPGDDAGYDDNWYVYVETSSGSCDGGTDHAYLTYSGIDMDSYPKMQVYFAYNMYGSNMGQLNVQIDDGEGGWDTLWSISANQGTEWFYKNVSFEGYSGTRNLRFDYYRNGITGFYGDIALDVLNISQPGGTGEPDTDANKTAVEYSDVISGSLYEQIDNITVTVNVSYYNTSGSINNSNTNATLWLEIYNGTDWIDEGDFEVGTSQTTGNYSLIITTASVLTGWNTLENRDVRISARMLDYNNSWYDTINWTDVWIETFSEQEFINDTWTAFSTNPDWSNVTKVVGSGIVKWKVYANDTSNNWNASEIFSFTTEAAVFIDIFPSSDLDDGIQFGNVDPGTNDNIATRNSACNSGTCYNITIDSATTVNVDLYHKTIGNLGTIAIENVTHQANITANNGDNLIASGSISLTTSYIIIGTNICQNLGDSDNCWIKYWLDVPSAQSSGDLETTYYYCGVENGQGSGECS